MSEGGEVPADVRIRPAIGSDAGTIVRFVKELAEFEKEPSENVLLDEATVLEHAFGDRPHFEVLIAEKDSYPVGMVLFFENYSTWAARPGTWIEELFVEENHRGNGIGVSLIQSVVQLAKHRGYGRVELAVLNWNPAVDFYRSQGFEKLSEWSIYRLPIE